MNKTALFEPSLKKEASGRKQKDLGERIERDLGEKK